MKQGLHPSDLQPIMAFGVIDIVTGATQGIGRATAESIAHNSNTDHALFLVGRSVERGTKVADSLRSATNRPVFFEPCDLSDYDQVLDLKGRIAKRVDEDFRVNCLVNCAAECPRRQVLVERRTREGAVEKIDGQFASNVLSQHFTMRAFQDRLDRSYIVNVASNWAGDLDLRDLHFRQRPYDNDTAYRQSKQCNRMLTAVWADKLPGSKVNSCHPGDPCTTLSKDLGYNLWAPPPTRSMIEKETPIPFLCGYAGNLQATAGWYQGRSETGQRDRFMSDKKKAQELFDICETYCHD
jgi:NAD(P)-dependent dehydrogenase (short-subunit alcohol dehydrogenase family)